MGIERKRHPRCLQGRKSLARRGVVAAMFSPLGLMAFLAIGAVISISAVSLISGYKTSSNIAAAHDELQLLHSSAQDYSSYATDYGSGFVGLTAETIKPFIKTEMRWDNVSGASGALCSSTAFGCKIKYYFATDADGETFHLYVDASKAISDEDDVFKYELALDKLSKRMVKNRKINGAASSVTSDNSTPSESINNKDAKLELFNLS